VGTGGGLPGLPLAIAHPDKYFVLLDARVKKCHFLTQMVHELGLSNVEVVCKRAEDYQPDVGFSAILTRAFSSLNNMLKLTQHLKQPQGCFLAMKGTTEASIDRITQAYGFRGEVVALQVPFLAAERHLLIIKDVNCG
jgi:16S rRNA (guanine527-N7)-methyltransferase